MRKFSNRFFVRKVNILLFGAVAAQNSKALHDRNNNTNNNKDRPKLVPKCPPLSVRWTQTPKAWIKPRLCSWTSTPRKVCKTSCGPISGREERLRCSSTVPEVNSLLFLFYSVLFISFVFLSFCGDDDLSSCYYDEISAEFPPAGEPASEKAIDLVRETWRRFVWLFGNFSSKNIFRGLLLCA